MKEPSRSASPARHIAVMAHTNVWGRATNAANIERRDVRMTALEVSTLRRGYEAQERTEREVIGITHRLGAVERSVEAIRPTTAELEKVRDRVMFAGSLGRAMWTVGKALSRPLPGRQVPTIR